MADNTVKLSSGETAQVVEATSESYLELPELSTRFVQLELDYYSHAHDGRTSRQIQTTIKSPNYAEGESGWIIKENGDVEFSSGTFRGAVTAATITASAISGSTITGTTISGGQITGTDIFGTNIYTSKFASDLSTTYDNGIGFFIGYNSGDPRFFIGNSAGNKMTWDGTRLKITLTSNGGLTLQMPSDVASQLAAGITITDSGGTPRNKINDRAFITSFNRSFSAASNTDGGDFGNDWFNMFCESDLGGTSAGVLELPVTGRFLMKYAGGGAIIRIQYNGGGGAIDLFEPLILRSLAADPTIPFPFSSTGTIYFNTALAKIRVHTGSGWETVTSA